MPTGKCTTTKGAQLECVPVLQVQELNSCGICIVSRTLVDVCVQRHGEHLFKIKVEAHSCCSTVNGNPIQTRSNHNNYTQICMVPEQQKHNNYLPARTCTLLQCYTPAHTVEHLVSKDPDPSKNPSISNFVFIFQLLAPRLPARL